MTDYQKLYKGISRAAWGFFFIYVDFNLNSISILPAFIGYLLFLSAIGYLCDEEKELKLLKTLGIILTVWHTALWIASWMSVDLNGIVLVCNIIIGAVSIYFHFQFLTNLASIASKHQPEGYDLDARLLRYRTLLTVLQTVSVILTYLIKRLDVFSVAVSFCMAVVCVIAGILLMKALFELRRCLSP